MAIVIAEDDKGHLSLIKKNLKRAGITNELICFEDGQEILDFLFERGGGAHLQKEKSYLLLLDIRMPNVDGIEVLRQIKKEKDLRKIPAIMLTTSEDPLEIEKCHELGCSNYITKPVDIGKFRKIIEDELKSAVIY